MIEFSKASAEEVREWLDTADNRDKVNDGLRGAKGTAPLHLAVDGGNIEAIKALLEAGAAPGVADFYGATLLHNAAAGNAEAVRLLLRTRNRPNRPCARHGIRPSGSRPPRLEGRSPSGAWSVTSARRQKAIPPQYGVI